VHEVEPSSLRAEFHTVSVPEPVALGADRTPVEFGGVALLAVGQALDAPVLVWDITAWTVGHTLGILVEQPLVVLALLAPSAIEALLASFQAGLANASPAVVAIRAGLDTVVLE